MLSWSSTTASICGLALSWKYNPQGWGASQVDTNQLLVVTTVELKGNDTKACTFGGLFKHHSKLVYNLDRSFLFLVFYS